MKLNELSLYKIAKSILKNDTYFKTWLTKIFINKCNDILRKNSKVIQLEEQK